jgi:hypothetical protein
MFVKFNCNSNFIPNYILFDVIVRLRNKKNYSFYRMYYIRNIIVDSLIEQ